MRSGGEPSGSANADRSRSRWQSSHRSSASCSSASSLLAEYRTLVRRSKRPRVRRLATCRCPAIHGPRSRRVRAATAAHVDAGSPGCVSFSFDASVTGAEVTVTVRCVARLQEASIVPFPGSIALTGEATEVLDLYREGTP